MKIEKLIDDQTARIAEYRDRYFQQAKSTEPADRLRAEAAARRMGEIAGVRINEIYWCNTPMDASSLRDSLSDSLWDSLRASLSDSLRASLWDSLSDSLRASLSDSLRDSLSDSLWDSLRASLRDSLRASLSDSLWDSLSDSLWDSLRASLSDSLWDTGWLAFYSYCAEVLNIQCDEDTREKLQLHNEISASCFALWIVPGAAVLCERPESVEIVDGKLIGMKWRSK